LKHLALGGQHTHVTCDMCDLWSNINLGVMLSLSLKRLQVFFCTFSFPIWPWELHILGQYSEIGWDLQLPEYMSEINF
jgi:hypothetical protein